MFGEIEIVADDGSDGRAHRLGAIAFGEKRLQTFLRFRRRNEKDARRAVVRAGRAPAHQIVDRHQHRRAHRLVQPFVLGARGAEDDVEGFVVDGVGGHGSAPGKNGEKA